MHIEVKISNMFATIDAQISRLSDSYYTIKQLLEKTEAQRRVDAKLVTEAFGQVASEFGLVKQLVERFDATGTFPQKTGEALTKEMLEALETMRQNMIAHS